MDTTSTQAAGGSTEPPADQDVEELQAELADTQRQLAEAQDRALAAEAAAEAATAAAEAKGAEPTRYAAWDTTYERFVEGTVRATSAAARKAAKDLGVKTFDVRPV